MERLPGAVSLARALITLARSRETGVLQVYASGDVCRIAIVDGTPRAATPLRDDDQALGDVLLRLGDLDSAAHGEALARGGPPPRTGAVGGWLVERGVATRPAVESALRRQLCERVLVVFACKAMDYCFEQGKADVGVPWIAEPMDSGDLVVSAMRRVVENIPMHRLSRMIGSGGLVLTSLGRALLQDTALWPEEAAMLPPLQAGTDAQALWTITDGAERSRRTLAALVLLSAVATRGHGETRYALLLRKRNQLRQQMGPRALLDLPAGAGPTQARRALRRLARMLHPDSMGPDTPAGLLQTSTEVMAGLIAAERRHRMQWQHYSSAPELDPTG